MCNCASTACGCTDEGIDLGFIVPNDGADGADGSNGSDGADGADAPTITGITINGSNELIFTFSDTTTINAGTLPEGECCSKVIDSVFDITKDESDIAGLITSITIPADTLVNDEDMLEYSLVVRRDNINGIGASDDLNMSFGDQGYAGDSNEEFTYLPFKYERQYAHIIGRIHRQSSSVAHCEVEIYFGGQIPSSTYPRDMITMAMNDYDVTVDWTLDNLLQISNLDTLNADIEIESFNVKFTKKD